MQDVEKDEFICDKLYISLGQVSKPAAGFAAPQITGIQKNKVIIEEKLKDLHGKIYVAEKELRLNKVE